MSLGFLLLCFLLVDVFVGLRMSRLVVREVARGFVLMELLALTLVRRLARPRFELMGDCVKCGACCRQIVFDPPELVKRRPRLLAAFVAYHRLAHAFTPVGRGPSGELVMSCGHLKTDGRCGIYRYRPLMCRSYPARPLFTAPALLPGCSYGVASRAVAAMRPRQSLRIVNPGVTVHHPTRQHRGEDRPEDFEWIA